MLKTFQNEIHNDIFVIDLYPCILLLYVKMLVVSMHFKIQPAQVANLMQYKVLFFRKSCLFTICIFKSHITRFQRTFKTDKT